MITYVALPFQAYELTHSTTVVGLLSAVEIIPTVALALVTGALADAVERRRLVMLAEAGALLVAALLTANALLDDPQLWLLFVAAVLGSACYTLLRPPLDALVPRLLPAHEPPLAASGRGLVRPEGRPGGRARERAGGTGAKMGGPALGGGLTAAGGVATAYPAAAATFVFSLTALPAMRATPPPADAEPVSLR